MNLNKLRLYFYLLAIVLALVQVWNTRFYMNPDGVSYLDIGDAYFRGDFKNAINAYWSPLYSWILGLFIFLCRPSMDLEFPLVHFVNFGIFIFSLFSFNYFLNSFLNFIQKRYADQKPLSVNSICIISWSLFLYTSLKFCTLWMVTPDLLLSGLVYVIFGILFKIQLEVDDNKNYFLLGLLLGISYLTKAVMLPIGVILLITLFWKLNFSKKVFISLVAFLVTSFPFMCLISESKSRLTFSDSGKLNYVWQVNNVTPFYMVHWQGGEQGIPLHTTKKIFSSPDVYEFSSPLSGTYAPWLDPSYWYEGIKLDLNISSLIKFIKNNMKEYFLIFFVYQGILIITLIYLVLKGVNSKAFIRNLSDLSFVLTPSLFTIFLYLLVYPELRYIAPFIVTIWIVVFSSLDFNNSDVNSKMVSRLIASFTLLIIVFAKFSPADFSYIQNSFVNPNNSGVNVKVAKGLYDFGLNPGDKVSTLGYGHLAFWARLGKFKISADIPDDQIKKYWDLDYKSKNNILNSFKKLNIKGLVSDIKPEDNLNWVKVNGTGYHVLLLH